jgi:hypothetical protein
LATQSGRRANDCSQNTLCRLLFGDALHLRIEMRVYGDPSHSSEAPAAAGAIRARRNHIVRLAGLLASGEGR